MLAKIDQEAEFVPENNPEMMTRLIGSLKGCELSAAESDFIFEIAGSKPKRNDATKQVANYYYEKRLTREAMERIKKHRRKLETIAMRMYLAAGIAFVVALLVLAI